MWPCSLCVLFIVFAFSQEIESFCWKPNHNPFTGVPQVERIDPATVRVLWSEIFPGGQACQEVDFLIKSHPVDSPSNYKLSDFTLRGQRSATLSIPPGSDFIFQVIARENKGVGVGIEYAYSRSATSISNPDSQQMTSLRRSIWVAGSNPHNSQHTNQYTRQPPSAPTTTTTTTITTTTVTTTATARPQIHYPPINRDVGFKEPGSYNRPQLKSLYSDYYTEEAETSPWYIYECVPLLKNLAGFESGSKKNTILKKFIQHMNNNAVETVSSFIGREKNCKKDSALTSGHLVEGEGTNKCCSTPWGDNSPQAVCYQQFARCDGGCIPHDWVADGWPDCLDGADEADMSVDGKVLPYQLGCVHCAGAVLSAGFLCRESDSLTRVCVESMLGVGQCNACITEYMDLP